MTMITDYFGIGKNQKRNLKSRESNQKRRGMYEREEEDEGLGVVMHTYLSLSCLTQTKQS